MHARLLAKPLSSNALRHATQRSGGSSFRIGTGATTAVSNSAPPRTRPGYYSSARALSASRVLRTTYFARTHEWLKVDDDKRTVTIGVSDFAQNELGKIVYVDMPDPPHHVPANESVAAIECGDGKAVGEVYTPQECEIAEVNQSLVEEPAIINEDCYGKGWIVKVKLAEDFAQGKLMTEEEYLKYLETCETHH